MLKNLLKLLSGKYVLVPKEPPSDLIESMCIRQDHAFAVNLPDKNIEDLRRVGSLMAGCYLTTAEKEVIRQDMRKVYEEVVGLGFYRYKE